MTVDRAEQATWEITAEGRDELIAFVPLSQTDVARIIESMQASQLSFCDAALQLKLLTTADIQQVSSRLRGKRKDEDRQGGVIETAIRRASERRDVTVRQGTARLSAQLRHVLHADDPRNE